jgi:hypothetical protein
MSGFETASCDAVLEVYKNALAVMDADRRVVAGGTLIHSDGLDGADVLLAQVLLHQGIGLLDLENFAVL